MSGPMIIEEVEAVPVLEHMADFPRYLEQRTRQPKERKPRPRNKPPSSPSSRKEG